MSLGLCMEVSLKDGELADMQKKSSDCVSKNAI
jgi:hypothetical protein